MPLSRAVVEESVVESVDPGDTGEIDIETSKDDIEKASTADKEQPSGHESHVEN